MRLISHANYLFFKIIIQCHLPGFTFLYAVHLELKFISMECLHHPVNQDQIRNRAVKNAIFKSDRFFINYVS